MQDARAAFDFKNLNTAVVADNKDDAILVADADKQRQVAGIIGGKIEGALLFKNRGGISSG